MMPLLVGERRKKEVLQKELDFKTKDGDDVEGVVCLCPGKSSPGVTPDRPAPCADGSLPALCSELCLLPQSFVGSQAFSSFLPPSLSSESPNRERFAFSASDGGRGRCLRPQSL